MKRHRSSFMLLTLSFTAALCALPSSALAGSLLSGYGGPGGGTQALLGSTLVNGSGPSEGGGGGAAGGGSSSGTGAATGGGSTASGGGSGSLGGSANAQGGSRAGSGSSAGGRGGAGGASRSSARGGSANGANGTSAGGSAAYTSKEGPRPVAGTAAARDAQAAPLGFTGTDALLLVLVLGVLGITMLLTRGLARTQENF